jgi:hypothetical protein
MERDPHHMGPGMTRGPRWFSELQAGFPEARTDTAMMPTGSRRRSHTSVRSVPEKPQTPVTAERLAFQRLMRSAANLADASPDSKRGTPMVAAEGSPGTGSRAASSA